MHPAGLKTAGCSQQQTQEDEARRRVPGASCRRSGRVFLHGWMEDVLRLLDRLEEIIISTLIGAATLVIFVAVLHRYGVSASVGALNWGKAHNAPWIVSAGKACFLWLTSINLTWAQELCIYKYVWMAKFGAAYGVRTGIHVGVDVAIGALGGRSRHRVVMFGLLCGALFTFLIGSLGAQFVYHMSLIGSTSPDLEIPSWIVYLAIPLGSYLMCFRFLQVAWTFARAGELPHHDHGHVEGIDDQAALVPGAVAHDDDKAIPAAGGAR
jgi:C4-dicarboxylate transporter DctQ subunit